jgi:hypothetical protein
MPTVADSIRPEHVEAFVAAELEQSTRRRPPAPPRLLHGWGLLAIAMLTTPSPC